MDAERKTSILIVDDDQGSRSSLSLILGMKGYETETAGTGREALEKAQERFFNVVLLDIRLPDMGGFDLLAPLKGMHPDTMVIIVTGYASLETAVQALNKGASAYITKPLDMDEVLPKVADVLERQCLLVENRRLYQAAQRELAERKRTEEALKRRGEQLTALVQASQAVIASLELDQVLAQIVSLASAVVASDYTSVVMVDEAGQLGRSTQNLPGIPGMAYCTRDEGLTNWVIRSRQPVIVDEIAEDGAIGPDLGPGAPRFANPYIVEAGIRSVAGLPLMVKDKLLGVLFLHSSRTAAFRDQLSLLTAFTSQVAIAIENARLYGAVQQQLGELALLNSASRVMVSSLDLETVMETTMRQAIEVLQVEAGSVLLRNPDTGELVFEAASGGGAEGLRGRRLLPGQGIAGWVAQHGVSLVVPDVRTDDRFYPRVDAGSGFTTRSILCVPLIYRDEVIGVMQALNKTGRGFGEHDRRLLEALASTAAIAIENARLYEAVQRELHERVRAEEALREERANLARRVAERTAELSIANAELARAARLKDEFLASMSHELRTPLNAVLGLSEALQEEVYGPLTERQSKSLHSIREAGHHLLALIDDVLDVAKIGAGKLELQIGPLSVESVCQASLRLVGQEAHKKRLRISRTLDSQVTTLQADERRLRQILVNLLSNAVKFTSEGGTIGLKVEGDAASEAVHFTVWDTGIGIPEGKMGQLFQPFVQLDSGLSRRHAGTGLGLALVRHLTEMHGGGISVESEVGKGSRFTVSLPWRKPALERSRLQVTSPSSPDLQPATFQPSDSQPLILLAEDNESNIDTIMNYLLAKGYRVVVARNGVEAIERAREEWPDLILMDIQMPEMDGLEATRRLRADTELAMVPVIALTALAMPNDREHCLKAGANVYLSKPVGLKQLVNVIEAQLSAGRKAQAEGFVASQPAREG